jgi:hypothetical protein
MTERPVESAQNERTCVYRILRYSPYQVRDEWLNIGVLVFDPQSDACRLRLIEEPEEFARVRRLHPAADEAVLRRFRVDLEDRFASARGSNAASIEALVQKWDETLSCAVQFSPKRGVISRDLDAELERIYRDAVAIPRARVRTPVTRPQMRSYCSQVFRQARLWDKIQKSVRVSEFTFPGDPMRIDYSYRRNGTRGFVQTLSVSRSPGDAKGLAHTFESIAAKSSLKTEFAAVTDVALADQNDLHRFVDRTLRGAGIEPVPLDHFAVWVAKLKPTIQ